jgi:hypothetical protein
MVDNNDGMLRVFWPSNLTRSTTPGVIVGWRNSALDLFVITILEDVEVIYYTVYLTDVIEDLTVFLGAQC